jgi:hypothetical protein
MLETSLKFPKVSKGGYKFSDLQERTWSDLQLFRLAKPINAQIVNGVLNLVQLHTFFLTFSKVCFAKIPSKLVENFNKIDNRALKEMDWLQ